MHKTCLPIAAILALAAALPAAAADIEVKSHIDAVAVYPDAAVVTRIAEVELAGGSSTLVFRGLPIGLDANSLRVTGEAAGPLAIGAVEARLAPVEAKLPDGALEARIKVLRAEREAVMVGIDAMAATQAMILRYAQATPEKLAPDARPMDSAQWGAAFEAIGKGLAKNGEDLRLAKARGRELDEAIDGLEASRQRGPVKAGPAREVSVALDAGAANSDQKIAAKLRLTYRISGAGWKPLYDARLDTGSAGHAAALELVRRAVVTQRTGEDWSDVALSVSTVRATRGTAAPDMQPLRLAFFDPPMALAAPRPAPMAAPPLAKGRAGNLAESEMRDKAAVEPALAQPVQAAEQQSSLDAGAFQVAFSVPGRVSIGTDGASKTFRLAGRAFNPTLRVKSVPALDETAYLEAHVINDEDVPLLPGEINIFRDGTFAGQGRVGLTAPGEAVDLGFGADDKVKVTRVPVLRKENEPTWFGQTKTETREFKIVVKNLHDFPIKVTIIDQMPFSENTAIIVEQLPATTAPTEKTVNDKRGVLGWSYDLAAAESRDIRLAYKMKWPADHDVVMQAAPNGR